MRWDADIVTEPTRNHELCLDLFEGGIHRARLQRGDTGEFELVCYGEHFAIPAKWLVDIIQRFLSETIDRDSTEQ